MPAVFDPSQAFLVDLDSDFICRLIADRVRNEDASEAVSDAESAGADDDDYEGGTRKRIAYGGKGVHQRCALSRIPRYGTTRMVTFRSHAGLAVVGKKNGTQESLLDDKLMYHLNKNIFR
ncbi:hypothetical protein AAVH_22579 [Aphelenchoides avenae]|nr:hypothetical protein AAVH_22579 [Aphelenchus avenae]